MVKRVIVVIAAVCLLALIVVPAFAGDSGSLAGARRVAIDPTVKAQIQARLDSLQGTEAQVNALRQSIEAQRNTNTGLLQSVRDAIRSERAASQSAGGLVSRDERAATAGRLRDLNGQSKQILAELQSLRQQAVAARSGVKEARLAKDANGVLASLDQLDGLTQQMLGELRQLSDIQRQIGDTLTSVK